MDLIYLVFGRLGLDSLPFWKAVQDPTFINIVNGTIATTAAAIFLIVAAIIAFLITWFRKWEVLFSEWLTSVDHKRIGIMYIMIALVMLTRAIIEAAFMRTQQAAAYNGGFLDPEHFGEFFSTHGTIMIFFMAMPFLTGVINFVMPMQIGARDVSFPVMNSVSLGLTAAGAMLIMISLVLEHFSTAGWSGYPPYSEMAFNPGPGVDYWIWAVTLSSIASMMTGINFAVTVYKERAPGMHYMRMPLFTWTALATSIMMIFAMPPLTVATGLLALDRYLGYHFFTADRGGNLMNYANLFWLFGHPEVYILILPPFGVFSEVFSTFSAKKLYGYTSLVAATMAIATLSFLVWLHHFFTMGQSPGVNITFGIATMTIGIPTGVKVYVWLLTMFRGRVRITPSMVYSLGFIVLFTIGGMTGVILANPSVDYQVHNTTFLVAHFHNVLIPGTLFGMLAAYNFWFPKAFGFRLNHRWGIASAVLFIIGFVLAFFPLYAMGLMGFPRRTLAYFEPAYQSWSYVAEVGAGFIVAALACLYIQLIVSIRKRKEYAVPAGDPWDGRSLEWSISAPPPEYNFAVLPEVVGRDTFWLAKERGLAYRPPKKFYDIEMPKNSWLGLILAAAGFLIAFGLVWYIWWMVVLAGLIAFAALVARGYVRDTVKIIPAREVERDYMRWLKAVRSSRPVLRDHELEPSNEGLAAHQIPQPAE